MIYHAIVNGNLAMAFASTSDHFAAQTVNKRWKFLYVLSVIAVASNLIY